jgi:hypothetical protein
MTTFQTIGLPLVALFAAITVAAIVRHSIQWRAGAAWLLVWAAAAYAIARPSITITVAHALGIGRGADLILYCSILAMLIGFFFIYVRFRRLDREITRLVRHMAIADGEGTIKDDRIASSEKVR